MSEIIAGLQLKGGQYVVEKEINSGATAVVWASWDTVNRKRVALKIIHFRSGMRKKERLMNQASQEVKIACGLKNNHIAKLLDVFVEARFFVSVWELVDGMDLLTLLTSTPEQRLPEDMAAFYFLQLSYAVLFLHEKGICHRDIKLENCMVCTKSMQLKLVDFGMSKTVESTSTIGIGTTDYMAPELLLPILGSVKSFDPVYDGRAVDSWAMGVILYVMVAGSYPFQDPRQCTDSNTLLNITKGNYFEPPPFISQGCKNLIDKLLKADPLKRSTLSEICKDRWLLKSTAAYYFRMRIMKPDNSADSGLYEYL